MNPEQEKEAVLLAAKEIAKKTKDNCCREHLRKVFNREPKENEVQNTLASDPVFMAHFLEEKMAGLTTRIEEAEKDELRQKVKDLTMRLEKLEKEKAGKKETVV